VTTLRPIAIALALAAAVGVSACRKAPAPAAVAPAAPVAALSLEDGNAALARRDYEAAVAAYRAVLAREPGDVAVRYRLGVALGYLDRRDETAEAFRWVAERGRPGSEEVRMARQWLVQAGELDDPGAARPAGPARTAEPAAGGGEVTGRAQWADTTSPLARATLQILLDGADPSTRGRRFGLRTSLNEPFRLAGVTPGEYRLIAQIGMVRLWDTKITVQEGRPTVVDLTPETSAAGPDALRPAGRRPAGATS
jgi:hypothetical protein